MFNFFPSIYICCNFDFLLSFLVLIRLHCKPKVKEIVLPWLFSYYLCYVSSNGNYTFYFYVPCAWKVHYIFKNLLGEKNKTNNDKRKVIVCKNRINERSDFFFFNHKKVMDPKAINGVYFTEIWSKYMQMKLNGRSPPLPPGLIKSLQNGIRGLYGKGFARRYPPLDRSSFHSGNSGWTRSLLFQCSVLLFSAVLDGSSQTFF